MLACPILVWCHSYSVVLLQRNEKTGIDSGFDLLGV